jgi:hypothetical protein
MRSAASADVRCSKAQKRRLMRDRLDRSADRDPGTLGTSQAFDTKNCAATLYGTVWLHLACLVKVVASGCMQSSYKHNAQVPPAVKKSWHSSTGDTQWTNVSSPKRHVKIVTGTETSAGFYQNYSFLKLIISPGQQRSDSEALNKIDLISQTSN